jgi:hypothetical protein
MAISKEERNLLAQFWEKHKDLLISAMLSIGDYVPLEDEERNLVSQVSDTLKTAVQRDITRYTWEISGGGNLPKGRLVLEIVTHYASERAPQLSFPELKNAFPDELQGGTFGVFAPLDSADASNFKGHKRYYTDKAISLADGPVAVCDQWHVNNIDLFIKGAEKLGYLISSTR